MKELDIISAFVKSGLRPPNAAVVCEIGFMCRCSDNLTPTYGH